MTLLLEAFAVGVVVLSVLALLVFLALVVYSQ